MEHWQVDHSCLKGDTDFNSIPKTSMVLSCLAIKVKDNGISRLTVPDRMMRRAELWQGYSHGPET